MSTNPYETPETTGHEPAPAAAKWPRFTLLHLLGVIGILGFVCVFILPNVRMAREPARRTACSNNLKQIAVGMLNYESKYGCLPPAYTVDEDGNRLHSWRTLILPWIENVYLYNQIDLTKPWDDPVNQEAAARTPGVYRCPSGGLIDGQTGYLAVVAPGGCFAGSAARKLSEITDQRGRTLMVIEVHGERAVPWMSPQDADEETVFSLVTDKRHPHPSGSHGMLADGSTQIIRADIKTEFLRAMITINADD